MCFPPKTFCRGEPPSFLTFLMKPAGPGGRLPSGSARLVLLASERFPVSEGDEDRQRLQKVLLHLVSSDVAPQPSRLSPWGVSSPHKLVLQLLLVS